MRRKESVLVAIAFLLYFLTGAICIVVGSGLTLISNMYNVSIAKTALLGSAFAMGRVMTAIISGHQVNRIGPKKVLVSGVLMYMALLIGIPMTRSYYAGLAFAFMGGIGMGVEDAICPLFLSKAYPQRYAAALSAGQAFFGLGSFATPFLIGRMLDLNKPFYYAYYLLCISAIILLILVPFVKFDGSKSITETEGETIKPLYTHGRIVFVEILVALFTYCAITNSIGLYTAGIAEETGMKTSNAEYLLTIYNAASFVGSIVFIGVLKKIHTQDVLIINAICSAAAIAIMRFSQGTVASYVALMVSGFMLGVLFSVIIEIGTRVEYTRISVASSILATVAGASDVSTPIITGALIRTSGIFSAYGYALIMAIVTAWLAVMIKFGTREKEEES